MREDVGKASDTAGTSRHEGGVQCISVASKGEEGRIRVSPREGSSKFWQSGDRAYAEELANLVASQLEPACVRGRPCQIDEEVTVHVDAARGTREVIDEDRDRTTI